MNLFEEANQANVEIVNERQRFQADKDRDKDRDKERDKERDRDKEREEENKLNYYYYSSSNSTEPSYVDNSALILYGIMKRSFAMCIPLPLPKTESIAKFRTNNINISKLQEGFSCRTANPV